jgi:hypothetical protein
MLLRLESRFLRSARWHSDCSSWLGHKRTRLGSCGINEGLYTHITKARSPSKMCLCLETLPSARCQVRELLVYTCTYDMIENHQADRKTLTKEPVHECADVGLHRAARSQQMNALM